MDPIKRFLGYAAAFEECYSSDDWTKLDQFFTEDAVYQPLGAFGGPVAGRKNLEAALKDMVDGFDRRFESRGVEVLEGPAVRDGAVWFRWLATYTLAGAPPLSMAGEEIVKFEGDRIRHLEDRITEEEAGKIVAYLAEHGRKLKPAK